MNFFKNRFVATCLLLAVLFGVTPVVAQGQLQDRAENVQEQFYDDKDIHKRLRSRGDAAGNLVSIAVGYPSLISETEALRFAHETFQDVIGDDDLEDIYDANAELELKFQTLYKLLVKEDLDETDQRAVESYANTFNGAQRMIESSDYNEQVKAFHQKTLDRWPASMLAEIFDLDLPEYYAPDSDNIDSGHHTEHTSAANLLEPPEAPEAPDLDETLDEVDDLLDTVFDGVGDTLDSVGDLLDDVLD